MSTRSDRGLRSEALGSGSEATFPQVGQDAPAQGSVIFNWFVEQTSQYEWKTLLDVAQLCDLIQNVVLEIGWIMHFNFYAFKFFNVSLSDLWVSYDSGYTWNTLHSVFYLLIDIEPNVHSKKYKNTFVFWAKESVLLKNKFDVFKSFEFKKNKKRK